MNQPTGPSGGNQASRDGSHDGSDGRQRANGGARPNTQTRPDDSGRVDTVLASAGTGKTYDLVTAIEQAVVAGLDPSALVATTFTNRAADELASRVRERLVARGHIDAATAMLGARIGTVNAVCGGWLQEYAFELGRAPVAEVIDEARVDTVFARATAAVIAAHEHLGELAERFGMSDARAGRRFGGDGWRDHVRRIVDLARLNEIPAEALPTCADRSLAGLLALLGDAHGDADALDRALAEAVTVCAERLTPGHRETLKKTTRAALPPLDQAYDTLRLGQTLPWPGWARLAKLKAAQADGAVFDDVTRAAAAHPHHPRLRSDLRAFVTGQFACAADCLPAYAAYKAERGLVDFVDQEQLALRVLREPALAERLRDTVEAVFVDEYQDSSPIQVALFAALARHAPASVWVGDPKQSVYRFRDADPALTTATARRITHHTGGRTRTLRTSWRSRPGLVELINAAFTPHFMRQGASLEEVAFERAERRDDGDAPPPLAAWTLDGKTKAVRTDALADALNGLLSQADAWPVQPKGEAPRPARGSDVGVLCRTHDDIARLAGALAQRGVRSAVEREHLMRRPEIELAVAALRWVADPSDSLAGVELVRFASDDQAWLDVAFAGDRDAALARAVPFVPNLARLRDELDHVTPAELVDRVLHAPGLLDAVRAWGDVPTRLTNLEALRGLARVYQDEQRTRRRSVSAAGLCAWLAQSDAKQPPSAHPDAVQLLTYHAAKGLEWPIAVLTCLAHDAAGDAFGVHADGPTEPDWREPLRERSIRYWPNPYAGLRTGTHLHEAAAATPEGRREAREVELEAVRVLYMGATRARDYLVFALEGTPEQRHWLNALRDGAGAPALRFETGAILAGSRRFEARTAPPTPPDPAAHRPSTEYGPPPATTDAPPTRHPPRVLRPSGQALDGEVAFAEVIALGPRLTLTGEADMRAVGEACHRFFASDQSDAGGDRRLARAERILRAWGVTTLVPQQLLAAADRLRAFLAQRYPGAAVHHEWPVHARVGHQVVRGRLDLLVDHGDAYALVDHKSFPGTVDPGSNRLAAFAGQAQLYARAVEAATGRSCNAIWLHQPIVGRISRCDVR